MPAHSMDETFPGPADWAPPLFECMITDDATAPTDRVGAQETGSNGLWHRDCAWAPRVDEAGDPQYPARGDRALVVVSDTHRPWIVAWTPYGEL